MFDRRCLVAAALLAPLVLATTAPGAGGGPAPTSPSEDARRKSGSLEVLERRVHREPHELVPLAAELARTGPSLYASSFSRGVGGGPALRAATIDGASATARSILGRLILRGDGPELAGSSYMLAAHMRAKQVGGTAVPATARDFYERRLAALASAAGLDAPPKGLRVAHAATPPDGSLRADALGFGLLAASRLSIELAGPRRTVGGGTAAGATAEEGFEGLLLLDVASAEVTALRDEWACDGAKLGAIPAADYDPFERPSFYARELRRSSADGGPSALTVSDPRSFLRDQAAIILGACEYVRAAATVASGLKSTGDSREEVFSSATSVVARDVARSAFRTMAATHFDPAPARRFFVSEFAGGRASTRAEVADGALAVLALEAIHDTFADEARTRAEARKLLEAEAAFLAGRLAADGTIAAAFEIAGDGPKPQGAATVGTEAIAIQAFLAAARVTGDARYGAAATRLARALEARRYDPWVRLYLEPEAAAEATIAPSDMGFLLGALRDLALEANAPGALDRLCDVHAALARAGAFGDGEAATLRLRVVRK